jgi:hypothetical protein
MLYPHLLHQIYPHGLNWSAHELLISTDHLIFLGQWNQGSYDGMYAQLEWDKKCAQNLDEKISRKRAAWKTETT